MVAVKPNARTSALVPADEGHWTATLKAAPVDGRANDELISLVARHFGCRRAAVTIAGGAAARLKRVRIDAA